MTLAEVLASVDRDSRDRLVEDVEDALNGHTPAEVFLVMAYFCALAISHLPGGDCDELLDRLPAILRGVIAGHAETVTIQ